jgi:hypothetical protein
MIANVDSISTMGYRRLYARFVLAGAIVCCLAPVGLAQVGGSAPSIRVEAHQVLVPLAVDDKVNGLPVPHLGISDFHLFEDGTERKIETVTVERGYFRSFSDNLGVQVESAISPTGKWGSSPSRGFRSLNVDFYVLAYVPPASVPGACHQIRVTVAPRDATGGRFVTAELQLASEGGKILSAKVDRRDLLVSSRSEYCSTEHSSSDPLNGTKISLEMESYVASEKTMAVAPLLQASSFFAQTGYGRVHLALDFPPMGNTRSVLGLGIALLGLIYRKDGTLSTRFSDSMEGDCNFYSDNRAFSAELCRESIPNHYEAQIALLPGAYELWFVMKYGGKLSWAKVPLVVDAYDGKNLVISQVALCKRFHELRGADKGALPTLPFDFVPLVSKEIEFTPAGSTRFKKGEPLVAYFEVYEPLLTGAGSGGSVQFQMQITDVRTGELKTNTGLRPAASFIRPGSFVIPIAEQVATERLSSGTYRLEVQASDSAGNKTEWRAATFTVE